MKYKIYPKNKSVMQRLFVAFLNRMARWYYQLYPKDIRPVVGIPYQRDPDAVCETYEPFLPRRGHKHFFTDCESDGHYLCRKCSHFKDNWQDDEFEN